MTDDGTGVRTAPRGRLIDAGPTGRPHVYTPITDVLDGRIAPLEPLPESTPDRPLRLALVVPHFAFGSGGHQVVFALAHELEQRGHTVTTWVHDPHGERPDATGAVLRGAIREQYVGLEGPVFAGFEHWDGADVVLATGWQTVYPAMSLPGCRARAYLVNDHEPEFYPTSLESLFAARTYTLGLPCFVGGGPWLADLLTTRYGAQVAGRFAYPVDPAFGPRPVARRDDTIVVYGRDSTPRRAVALALIALQELKARRPDLRVVLFGDQGVPECTFAYEHLGPIAPEDLSWVYSEATVGLAFSLTHGSLVPHDMLACGLPVVDLDGFGTAAEHADTGLVELAALSPLAIAAAVERLLDDPEERARRAQAGAAHVAAASWQRAADAVEAGLRTILRARVGVA
ncbi:glycosyltransferase family 4 protein [Paraconexibacter antarcticus]|uniref:Glycosyltransferase family 4 protein n=1 Tax=Paraconexibacter antarcticus TaxID=2949664 RepID=A0ABY5DS10_9ACTN|nr:glycosyltransferase family 4 protein [Paraconexibacter antarcticus]UTI63480.1 glycosyltransferase family 4 protein [Paraconexibacter antarcticus]